MTEYTTTEISTFSRPNIILGGMRIRKFLTLPKRLQRLFSDRNAREVGYIASREPIRTEHDGHRINEKNIPTGIKGYVTTIDESQKGFSIQWYKRRGE